MNTVGWILLAVSFLLGLLDRPAHESWIGFFLATVAFSWRWYGWTGAAYVALGASFLASAVWSMADCKNKT